VPKTTAKRPTSRNNQPKASRGEKLQTRLSPSARRSLILQGAIEYFAEVGFTGKTRELSERLGITQPLLYRYFPSKEVLMEEVFEIVFLDSWRPGWDRLLNNQGIPLQERLIEFYQEYFEDSFSRRWIRVYLYSGLAGTGLNQKYLKMIRQRLIDPVCLSLRNLYVPKKNWGAISDDEREFVWMLHGSFFAYAMRKYIFNYEAKVNFKEYLTHAIENFLDGAKANYPKLNTS
jgi:AcrR family transcriptional regulator